MSLFAIQRFGAEEADSKQAETSLEKINKKAKKKHKEKKVKVVVDPVEIDSQDTPTKKRKLNGDAKGAQEHVEDQSKKKKEKRSKKSTDPNSNETSRDHNTEEANKSTENTVQQLKTPKKKTMKKSEQITENDMLTSNENESVKRKRKKSKINKSSEVLDSDLEISIVESPSPKGKKTRISKGTVSETDMDISLNEHVGGKKQKLRKTKQNIDAESSFESSITETPSRKDKKLSKSKRCSDRESVSESETSKDNNTGEKQSDVNEPIPRKVKKSKKSKKDSKLSQGELDSSQVEATQEKKNKSIMSDSENPVDRVSKSDNEFPKRKQKKSKKKETETIVLDNNANGHARPNKNVAGATEEAMEADCYVLEGMDTPIEVVELDEAFIKGEDTGISQGSDDIKSEISGKESDADMESESEEVSQVTEGQPQHIKTKDKTKKKSHKSSTKETEEIGLKKKQSKVKDIVSEKKSTKQSSVQSGKESESGSDSSDDSDDSSEDSGDEAGGKEEASTQEKDKPKNEVGGFTVLGRVPKQQQKQVVRVLPAWLAKPSIMSGDVSTDRSPFSDIPGLSADLVAKLQEEGITSLFPVQSELIPVLLDGVRNGHVTGPAGYRPPDICCSAPTGSGKTLAFAIPIIQALSSRVSRHIRALVMLPTTDLAHQVKDVFDTYCAGTGLQVALVTHSKQTLAQEQALLGHRGVRGDWNSLVDILVATPGRLVDHINNTPGFNLQHLRFLVIDEADRVMAEVKQDWLSVLERAINKPHPPLNVTHSMQSTCCQKLLFSATLSQNPEKLKELKLFQPKLFTSVRYSGQKTEKEDIQHGSEPGVLQSRGKIDHSGASEIVTGEFIGKYTAPAGLEQLKVECSPAAKPLVVKELILINEYKRVLCFANTVKAAHRLFLLMEHMDIGDVRELTSHIKPAKKQQIIKQLSDGKIKMIVCTDTLARGMDVKLVDAVISYDFPYDLNTHVHRVGRTARAGQPGTAITLLQDDQAKYFKTNLAKAEFLQDMKLIKFPPSKLNKHVDCMQAALLQVSATLQKEQNANQRWKKNRQKRK